MKRTLSNTPDTDDQLIKLVHYALGQWTHKFELSTVKQLLCVHMQRRKNSAGFFIVEPKSNLNETL